MKPEKMKLETIEPDSELMQAADRALEKKNPKLAALIRQGIKEHQEAVKAGRWKPLR